jgi:hypothetical protein
MAERLLSRRVRCASCRCARRFGDWSDEILNTNTKNIYLVCGISCARSYRTLRDGSLEGCFPRHFVPGYDQAVPPGQNTFSPAEALLKSALIGFQPWEAPK